MTGKRGTIVERFWPKVQKDGPVSAHQPHLGPCWIWTAGKNPSGHGMLRSRRQDGSHGRTPASHVSWEIHYGLIPDGLWVLHHCDNPPCVRPEHLFLGTAQDNVDDMAKKGRRACGERLNTNKITEREVREIRRLATSGIVQRRIAEQFGLSYANVCLIVNRKAWQHID